MARRRGLFQWGLRGSAQRMWFGPLGVGEGVSPFTVSRDSGTSKLPGFSAAPALGDRATGRIPPSPATPVPKPCVMRVCPLQEYAFHPLMSCVPGECEWWQRGTCK